MPLISRKMTEAIARSVFGYSRIMHTPAPSFAAARQHPWVRESAGYGSNAISTAYTNRDLYMKRESDYASLFHIEPFLRPGVRVADVGGSVGMAYYVASRHLPLPPDLVWTVYDLPRMIEVGRRRALEEGASGLRFTSDFDDLDGADVLVTAGALQYIEEPLSTTLRRLKRRPPYILINRVPVWDKPALYCVETLGEFSCVYTIFNRSEFLQGFLDAGYELYDDWLCDESRFSLRFRPQVRVRAYSGFYLADPAFPSPRQLRERLLAQSLSATP